jgi:hypothetical protein
MYKLTLGAIEQNYPDLDSAMTDCFEIYPNADFSNWNEKDKFTWMDIYENNKTSVIIGTIQEVL